MTEITFERLPEAVGRLLDRLDSIEQLITSNQQGNTEEADQLLTIQEAAKFINLSVATIYTLKSRSEIPVSKKGKRLYFSKQELTDWIKSGRRKTIAEIDAEATDYLKNKKR